MRLLRVENIFEVIFLAGFVLGTVIRKVYTARCRGAKSAKKRRSVLDIILIIAAGAGWAFMVTFVPFYLVRIPQKERMMLEAFGEEYRKYISRTGGMIPRIRK